MAKARVAVAVAKISSCNWEVTRDNSHVHPSCADEKTELAVLTSCDQERLTGTLDILVSRVIACSRVMGRMASAS